MYNIKNKLNSKFHMNPSINAKYYIVLYVKLNNIHSKEIDASWRSKRKSLRARERERGKG